MATPRANLAVVLAMLLALLAGWALVPRRALPEAVAATGPVGDDAGDQQATTGWDGPMVRRRVAIALHVAPGADRARIERELGRVAAAERVGPLRPASFAVFSEQMLTYLVPEMTMVLPENATTEDAEVLMRDHTFPGVTFHLVQNVLVHDLTFAVFPHGVSPDRARRRQDDEGVLSDSLNHYETVVQRSGLTVRYFGAIISDRQVQAVRESMARAGGVTAAQVAVAASEPGPGVDLSAGVPDLNADPASRHSHS